MIKIQPCILSTLIARVFRANNDFYGGFFETK